MGQKKPSDFDVNFGAFEGKAPAFGDSGIRAKCLLEIHQLTTSRQCVSKKRPRRCSNKSLKGVCMTFMGFARACVYATSIVNLFFFIGGRKSFISRCQMMGLTPPYPPLSHTFWSIRCGNSYPTHLIHFLRTHVCVCVYSMCDLKIVHQKRLTNAMRQWTPLL